MASFPAILSTKSWKKLTPAEKNGTLPKFDAAMVNEFGPWLVDFSRSGMTRLELKNLIDAAEECNLKEQISKAFAGERINHTENRQVLHMSLRDQTGLTPKENSQLVAAELLRLKAYVHKIRRSDITDIVNIGIGGSDLGPKLLTQALAPFATGPKVHYVSNVDPAHLEEVLIHLNPETTLFVIVSKTFTTQETMQNAHIAKTWSEGKSRFCAVSASSSKAKDFGIESEDTFAIWDWVGGRFSLWSAVGLSTMLSVGAEVFDEVLLGAHEADTEFKKAPLEKNLAVLLALWDIWNINHRKFSSVALLPYEQNLEFFSRWFQQLAMESNGKKIDRDGKKIDYQTSPVYWGEVGTNGQHAFYQMLHQGTQLIPCEFIGFAKSYYKNQDSQKTLLANMLGQAKAFAEGSDDKDLNKQFDGGRPSITLLAQQASPRTIGGLLALYENRVMAQGFLWNISSFDQWGVELGKKLAKNIEQHWENGATLDEATKTLLAKIRKFS
tara:strand:- start:21005 stop:22495 length:1491 start_codon:yes stop_codon:yes gene_type:complete